ncbi:hydrogenase assembly chaperone HypC/HupF [Beggiatoa alba B18LD]|uniref:Hydrogenase assembly chaperone HypC/HupF n=1 Tax=Beggiatoa alba B18LD TaxID=395493 RepID=I3CHR4_9GAMM|nr:HypC/HybG/HupF family hydrogenase formation chaperone [Beggiatoa alba]EIJ43157.1 hydrogenase assembly chaperone HypC/HupF [Beggiatoa alba B18LD]
MCLGIPMQVVEINGFNARCQAKGVERDINLFMLQHDMPVAGEYVMVHVGYALQKMTEQDAQTTWELLDEIANAQANEPF